MAHGSVTSHLNLFALSTRSRDVNASRVEQPLEIRAAAYQRAFFTPAVTVPRCYRTSTSLDPSSAPSAHLYAPQPLFKALPSTTIDHGRQYRPPRHHREPTNIVFVDLCTIIRAVYPSWPTTFSDISPRSPAQEPTSSCHEDDFSHPARPTTGLYMRPRLTKALPSFPFNHGRPLRVPRHHYESLRGLACTT
ncbi:hypothetical protein C0995_003807 [Termitomyces sp. Mi166|nr:hypothetical protein C0995_003807 [Termitomyces sp. Mi166\